MARSHESPVTPAAIAAPGCWYFAAAMDLLRRTLFASVCAILMLAAPVSARTMVRLAGDIPPGISVERLDNEYSVLCRRVAPRHGCGRSAVRVVFYREREQPLIAGRLPEWGGGGAIGPDTAVVAVDKPFAVRYDLERVVVHELVHCALLRAARGVDLPRWFHEGVAMTLAGEISFDEQVALSRAVLAGRLLSLPSVDSVNMLSPAGAELAYSQSHAAVLFLVDKYGIDVISAIVEASVETGHFDDGIREALGFTPEELALVLRDGIRGHYGLAFIFGDLAWIWLIVLAVAVLAFFAVRRRNRQRKAAMEREESARREVPPPEPEPPASPPAPAPGPADDFPPLPVETEEAADLVAEWAQTWRLHPEDPESVLVAAWLFGECLLPGRHKPVLRVALEFDPLDDDDDEDVTFERLRPVWLDSLNETLAELRQSFAGVEIVPCYSDDDAFFGQLERDGLLVYERDG